MAISKRLRFEILRRDNHQCRYCGAQAPDVKLQIDHVTPEALGGKTEPSNLVAACATCNNGKSSVPSTAELVDDVAQDALRWANAMKVAAATYEAQVAGERLLNADFKANWDTWTVKETKEPVPLPDDWSATITRFRQSGLTDVLMAEALLVAMNATGVRLENVFRYFCGVAWRMVAELQDRARSVVDSEPADGSGAQPEIEAVISAAIDGALSRNDARLDPWIYDELVLDLAKNLRRRC